MMHLLRYALLSSLLLTTAAFSQAPLPLRLVIPGPAILEPESTWRFYEQALKLALAKTAITPTEQFEIVYYTRPTGRERARFLVKQGEIDVMWSSTNKKREMELAPVRFNLLKGVNEYRQLLIRATDQHKFDKVKTLEDLRKFKVGTGVHWSDTQVYIFNNMPLVTAYAYEPMFRMLAAKRFDYMARGLQEIDGELQKNSHLNLAIENNILIHYSQPIYFFLNKKNTPLANRIKQGLELAQEDGSLDELFMSIPSFRAAIEKLHNIDHQVIELQLED